MLTVELFSMPLDNAGVGSLSWVVVALAATAIARRSAIGVRRRLVLEITVAMLGAMLFGALATARDFGGWAQLDWRSATFAFLGALAAIGAARIRLHSAAG